MHGIRHHDGCNGLEPFYGLSGLVQSPHMGVASREKPMCGCPTSMLLQRSQQHRCGVVKLPGEKVSHADCHECTRPASVWAEPQGGLKMTHREFRLPRPKPKPAAYHPAV